MANFTRLGLDDTVAYTEKLTTNTWTNATNNLTTAFTSSTQASFNSPTSSGHFFIEVFNEATSSATSEVQYAISYGHKGGSGSVDFTNDTGSFGFSPSKTIYHQYKNLVFGNVDQNFKFGTHTPPDIYVININRSRYKHNLKPGSLNLFIQTGGGGAGEKLRLTDDSVTQTGSAVITNVGRQFNIVSGADGVMIGSALDQTSSGSYGLFYPDAGFILLNPDAIGDAAFGTGLLSVNPQRFFNQNNFNGRKLFNAISASGHFILDSQEQVTSNYYFLRVRNQEFNYSANPSFKLSNGNLRFVSMHDNPKTYITTVGLYNDSNELLAVAKLSQPLEKTFAKEALIRMKLDH